LPQICRIRSPPKLTATSTASGLFAVDSGVKAGTSELFTRLCHPKNRSTARTSLHFKEWDVPILRQGQGWTRSGRILLFEFGNDPQNFKLYLIIGPGPAETRQRLFDMASQQHPLKPAFKTLGKSYSTIFVRSFSSPSLYEDAPSEQIQEDIEKKWAQFRDHDLPAILSALKEQKWIWGRL